MSIRSYLPAFLGGEADKESEAPEVEEAPDLQNGRGNQAAQPSGEPSDPGATSTLDLVDQGPPAPVEPRTTTVGQYRYEQAPTGQITCSQLTGEGAEASWKRLWTQGPGDAFFAAAYDAVKAEHGPHPIVEYGTPEAEQEAPEATSDVEAAPASEEGGGGAPLQHGRIANAQATVRTRNEQDGRVRFDSNHEPDIPNGTIVVWVKVETGSSSGAVREVVLCRWTEGSTRREGWTNLSNFENSGPLSAEEEAAYVTRASAGSERSLDALKDSIPSEDPAIDQAARNDVREYRESYSGLWDMAAWVSHEAQERLFGESEAPLEDTGPPTVGWITILPDCEDGYLYRNPGRGLKMSLGYAYPGDRLAVTGAVQEIAGEQWVQVKLGGGGGLGWISSRGTNADDVLQLAHDADVDAAREEAERAEAEAFGDTTPEQPDDLFDSAPGLQVVGMLVPRTNAIPVYGDAWSYEEIGQIPTKAGAEGLFELIGELSGSDARRREILFAGRPGYVDARAVREADDVDLVMHADVLDDDDIDTIRRALSRGEVEPTRQAYVYMRLQEVAPADEGATFQHGGERSAAVEQLAAALRALGVPNPYPDLSYADALEMVRLEQGLGDGRGPEHYRALAEAFGVGGGVLPMAHPGLVFAQLISGRSVLVEHEGALRRVRAVDANQLVLDGVNDPIGVAEAMALGGVFLSVTSDFDRLEAPEKREQQLESGVVLDDEATVERYDELYERTSTAESDWYERTLGRDTSRQEAATTVSEHSVDVDRAEALARAPSDKVVQAFRRLLAMDGAVEARLVDARSYLAAVEANPSESNAHALPQCVESLHSYAKRSLQQAFAMGEATGLDLLAAMEALGNVGGQPLVDEGMRDVVKHALVAVPEEGEPPSAVDDREVDMDVVRRVPISAAYGATLLENMQAVADEASAERRTADAAFAVHDPTHASQPTLEQAWLDKRYAEQAGWFDASTRYDGYFVALEKAAGHFREGSQSDPLLLALSKAKRSADEDMKVQYVNPHHGHGENKRQKTSEEIDDLLQGSDDLTAADCSSFAYWTLKSAGYDLDQVVGFNAAGEPLVLRQVVNAEGPILNGPGGQLTFGELMDQDSAIVKGAAGAFEMAGIGKETRVEEIKPGDFCQTRRRDGGGHATICHTVTAHGSGWFGDRGSPTLLSGAPSESGVWLDDVDFVIDDGTVPEMVGEHTVDLTRVQVVGAHNGGTNAETGETDQEGVFSRRDDFSRTNSDAGGLPKQRIYVGRLDASRWARWQSGAARARYGTPTA